MNAGLSQPARYGPGGHAPIGDRASPLPGGSGPARVLGPVAMSTPPPTAETDPPREPAAGAAAVPQGPVRRALTAAWHCAPLLFVLPPLMWSGNFLIGRGLSDSLPPIALAFWRWSVAGLIVLPFAWPGLRRHARLIARHWKFLALAGAANVAGYNALIYVALESTPVLNVSLVNSSLPAMIALVALVVAGERLAWRRLVGIAVSMVGVTVILVRGDLARLAELRLTLADFWVLWAVANYALYSVLLRWKPAELGIAPFLFCLIVPGVLTLLPFFAWEYAGGARMPLTWPAAGAVLYTALFASLAATVFWNRTVALIGATRTGLGVHLMPAFTGLGGWLLLGEAVSAFHLVGLAVIALGLTLTLKGRV